MTRHYLIALGLIVLAFWLGKGCGGDPQAVTDARQQEIIAKNALRDAITYRDSSDYWKARADQQRVIHDTVVVRMRSEEDRSAWEWSEIRKAHKQGVKRTMSWENRH